jgi:hypothetical protein
MELLACPMVVERRDDRFGRLDKIRPSGFDLHLRHEKVITHIVRSPHGDLEDDVELRHVDIGLRKLSCEG